MDSGTEPSLAPSVRCKTSRLVSLPPPPPHSPHHRLLPVHITVDDALGVSPRAAVDVCSCAAVSRKSRSRETALSKTDVMILRLLLPHERFFSSLVFATVAHSAPSLVIYQPDGYFVGGGDRFAGLRDTLQHLAMLVRAPAHPLCALLRFPPIT